MNSTQFGGTVIGMKYVRFIFSAIFFILVLLAFFPGGAVAVNFSEAPGESIAETATSDDTTLTSTRDRLFFISGGTSDDAAASILLLTMDEIDFLGMEISNSDCIYTYAMQGEWKILSYLQKTHIPVALSNARGFNAFPWSYRNDSYLVWKSEVLKDFSNNLTWPPYPSGEFLLQNVLKTAIRTNKPVTLLVTEPITPLSNLLRDNPTLNKGIKRVIWMGGAIHVSGNLDPKTIPTEIANEKAEWNAFWDPYAVDWFFKNTSFPIILFPLDVTNQAKLTDSFMKSLEKQSVQYRYSTLVYSLYSLVKDQPYFAMWNTLTSVYLARPGLFDTPIPMRLRITTEGYLQGTISEAFNGRLVDVILNLRDSEGFYDYFLEQLQRN